MDALTATTIDRLARRTQEPDWLTALRRDALALHGRLPWPHPSDDIWRRTDVSQLDPAKGFSLGEAVPLAEAMPLSAESLAALVAPMGDERLLARVNGAWLHEPPPGRLTVEELPASARVDAQPVRRILESDGMTPAEQKLSSLNLAFHHDSLVVRAPDGTTGEPPLRLVRAFSVVPQQALFPMTILVIGERCDVTIIDESLSVPAGGAAGSAPHLVNGRVELVVGASSTVRYVRLQRWDQAAREFLILRARLARDASLTMANISLGAALSKAHIATALEGEGASTKLYGFAFGRGGQHVDQHTLQDHRAPQTTSDLQFRAALQDRSRMVYTGLIRIAQEAQRTTAYQANHNLLLSDDTKAETIPMLEILADDVQCKHGASVGPIDDEQTFYLMSRGIPREAAQRLIVMGFIEPIIQQIPFEPLQARLRQDIEGELRHQ